MRHLLFLGGAAALVAACRPDVQATMTSPDGGCSATPYATFLQGINNEAQAQVTKLTRDALAACIAIAKELNVDPMDKGTLDGCAKDVSGPLNAAVSQIGTIVVMPAQQCDQSLVEWQKSVQACGGVTCDISAMQCGALTSYYSSPTGTLTAVPPIVSCTSTCSLQNGRTSLLCSRPDACSAPTKCISECGTSSSCDASTRGCDCTGTCTGSATAPVQCDGTCAGGTATTCRNSFPVPTACAVDVRCRLLANIHIAAMETCAPRQVELRRANGESYSAPLIAALTDIKRIEAQLFDVGLAYAQVGGPPSTNNNYNSFSYYVAGVGFADGQCLTTNDLQTSSNVFGTTYASVLSLDPLRGSN